jgi:hypothetical protein
MVHLSRRHFSKAAATNQGWLQGIAYFSRSSDSGPMEPKAEGPDSAQGLRLVRAYLALPPEKRQRVLQFVEELLVKHGEPREEAKSTRP